MIYYYKRILFSKYNKYIKKNYDFDYFYFREFNKIFGAVFGISHNNNDYLVCKYE